MRYYRWAYSWESVCQCGFLPAVKDYYVGLDEEIPDDIVDATALKDRPKPPFEPEDDDERRKSLQEDFDLQFQAESRAQELMVSVADGTNGNAAFIPHYAPCKCQNITNQDLHGYNLEGPLGAGGMSSVFLYTDKKDQKIRRAAKLVVSNPGCSNLPFLRVGRALSRRRRSCSCLGPFTVMMFLYYTDLP